MEQLRPDGLDEWQEYVQDRTDANLYHSIAWRQAAWEGYRVQAPFLMARARPLGGLVGVLPLFVAGNAVRRYVTTGMFGAYGRILCDDDAARDALLDGAVELGQRVRAHFVLIKSVGDAPIGPGFERQDSNVIAVLPLAPDPSSMWAGLRDKNRNAIRKAQSFALEPRWGPAQLDSFYDVLAENMHRKGTPIYGRRFLRAVLHAFGSQADVLTLSHQGEVISGAMVVCHRRVVYVPFASSRPSTFGMNPNNLLYWEILRRGCLEGSRMLDFGRSEVGASTLAFKLHWGAVQIPEPFYYRVLRGPRPRLDAHDRRVQWLSRLWQRLPRTLADVAGPPVARRYLV